MAPGSARETASCAAKSELEGPDETRIRRTPAVCNGRHCLTNIPSAAALISGRGAAGHSSRACYGATRGPRYALKDRPACPRTHSSWAHGQTTDVHVLVGPGSWMWNRPKTWPASESQKLTVRKAIKSGFERRSIFFSFLGAQMFQGERVPCEIHHT